MKYDFDFIEAISCWMNYGQSDKEAKDDLLKLTIPAKFKTINKPIFRVMAMNSPEDYYQDVGSYTTSKAVIQEFIQSIHFIDSFRGKEHAYLLYIKNPINSNCILNINSIFKDREFLDSIEYYESSGKYFDEGLEFKDSQKEVVYVANKNEFDNIFELQRNAKWKKIK
jgi:hypothetical protein